MSKQPPPAPTASAVGPCPTVIQIVGRPGTGSLSSTFAPPDHPRKRICLLRRYKKLLDRASLQKMYTSFIRPLLEYGDIIWDNSSAANKRALENIQVEALRITTGDTTVCSMQKLYDASKRETLQTRRILHNLCQLYKMINGLTPSYLYQLLPVGVYQSSRYPLRNSSDFSIPTSLTATYSNSFLPETLRAWNTLREDIRDAPSIGSFKKTLKTPMIFPPRYFDTIQLSREAQILHARIRLECSFLNHHLFKKNLVGSSLCTCGRPEASSRFFLFWF